MKKYIISLILIATSIPSVFATDTFAKPAQEKAKSWLSNHKESLIVGTACLIVGGMLVRMYDSLEGKTYPKAIQGQKEKETIQVQQDAEKAQDLKEIELVTIQPQMTDVKQASVLQIENISVISSEEQFKEAVYNKFMCEKRPDVCGNQLGVFFDRAHQFGIDTRVNMTIDVIGRMINDMDPVGLIGFRSLCDLMGDMSGEDKAKDPRYYRTPSAIMKQAFERGKLMEKLDQKIKDAQSQGVVFAPDNWA